MPPPRELTAFLLSLVGCRLLAALLSFKRRLPPQDSTLSSNPVQAYGPA